MRAVLKYASVYGIGYGDGGGEGTDNESQQMFLYGLTADHTSLVSGWACQVSPLLIRDASPRADEATLHPPAVQAAG